MDINQRFNDFREWCLSHVYSEPDTEFHTTVINQVVPKIVQDVGLTDKQRILDVGCGSGLAMTKFKKHGCTNIEGITASQTDVDEAISRGHICTNQDMSFTSFDDKSFDFLFARHSLEHSPYPLLTLKEFSRILKKGGGAYIEVPSPTCDRPLEKIENHYSIMGVKQWLALFERAGFSVPDHGEIKFSISNADDPTWSGMEVYEWYLLKNN